jgi:hypothetical protein
MEGGRQEQFKCAQKQCKKIDNTTYFGREKGFCAISLSADLASKTQNPRSEKIDRLGKGIETHFGPVFFAERADFFIWLHRDGEFDLSVPHNQTPPTLLLASQNSQFAAENIITSASTSLLSRTRDFSGASQNQVNLTDH